MRSRLAAHVMHSVHDSREVTKPARAAFMERFRKQVDPDGLLAPEERERRAQHALRAHMVGLALKSAKARRRSA
jgi:hypothetical protein